MESAKPDPRDTTCFCGGKGWYPECDDNGDSTGLERYCVCEAGQKRLEREQAKVVAPPAPAVTTAPMQLTPAPGPPAINAVCIHGRSLHPWTHCADCGSRYRTIA